MRENSLFVEDKISILIPTRNRPTNVRKVVHSIMTNAFDSSLVEVIFYVDYDDLSFPDEIISLNVKKIVGPRLWLSVLQNILYTHASGEIVMYAADDVQFQTQNWDQMVRDKFREIDDRIGLVFGNDLGSYGASIALHGFLHRKWINTLGVWVAPGRGSLYDLWVTEVARELGRLYYLEDLIVAHIHYRQGEAKALFDDTYKNVYSASKSWVPKDTYSQLKKERRIDHILLREVMNQKPPINPNYVLAHLVVSLFDKMKVKAYDQRRILSLTNFRIIPILIRNLFKIVLKK